MAGIGKHRRLVLGLCAFGFLASEIALQSTLWPKFGPTVSVLAGLVPLGVFGAVINAIEGKQTSKPDQYAPVRGQGVLKTVVVVLWAIIIASWFPMAEIENAALAQPDHPTAQFTQPIHLKGVVRYVTPRQALIDQWSHRMFFGGWLVGAFAAITYLRLEKRRPKVM